MEYENADEPKKWSHLHFIISEEYHMSNSTFKIRTLIQTSYNKPLVYYVDTPISSIRNMGETPPTRWDRFLGSSAFSYSNIPYAIEYL